MNTVLELVYILCSVTLISAFYILLQPFIRSMIRGIVTQSIVIGLICFVMSVYLQSEGFLLLGILVIVLRGFMVSYLLERQIPKRKELFRESTKGIPSTLLTALAVAAVGIFLVYYYIFYRLLTHVTIGTSTIVVFPFIMMFMGIYVIMSRKNTIAQVVGYVEGENSLVLMGIFLVPVPFIIELSVFIDVIAMVLIASIVAREKTDHMQLLELRG